MKTISMSKEVIAQLQIIELEKLELQADDRINRTSAEYRTSKFAALRVDFIETAEELRLYTNAIYNAIMWGKNLKDRTHA